MPDEKARYFVVMLEGIIYLCIDHATQFGYTHKTTSVIPIPEARLE